MTKKMSPKAAKKINDEWARNLGYDDWANFQKGRKPDTRQRCGTTTRITVPTGTGWKPEVLLDALKARMARDRLPGTKPAKGLKIEKATLAPSRDFDPKGHEAHTILISWENPYYEGAKP